MTHTGELHAKIAEKTSGARRSTREVKVPIYFSITVVLLWFIPKGLTKQRSNIAITLWHIGATYLSDPRKDWEGVIGVRTPTALRNTNLNVVEYKGLVGDVTSGATTTIRGVGRNLR